MRTILEEDPIVRKVAGYARVSTSVQANEGTSPEQQERVIRDECTRRGWELVEFYPDYGVSGKSRERPGLGRLQRDARDKKFDVVMFTKLDRLGRNLRDLKNIYHEINEQNGIAIISVEQPELNTEGAYGKLLIAMLGAFAEFEHSMIRDRTQSGRKAVWRQNKSIIGSLPFGYTFNKKEGRILINEEQKAIYGRIVAMYLDERLSLMDVANRLNTEGVKSPGRYGNLWNHVTVGKMLKNEAYTGAKAYNKSNYELRTATISDRQYFAKIKTPKNSEEWVTVAYPQLITEDRFAEIGQLMASKVRRSKRKIKGSEGRFLLDNNLLFCGECKREGRLVKQHNPNGRYNYYCYWKKASSKELRMFDRDRCTFKTDADELDNFVLSEVIEFLSSPGTFAKDWLENLNIDEMKKKLRQLEVSTEKERTSLERLYDRWSMVEEPIKSILQKKIKEHEKALYGHTRELSRTQKDFENAQTKYVNLEELEKLWFSPETSKRERIRSQFDYRRKIADFISSLSFNEQKRLVEAVISPETGGKITVRFFRPSDVEDDPDLVGADKPQPDKPPVVECDFRADLYKIANLIASFRRESLLINVIPRRVSGISPPRA